MSKRVKLVLRIDLGLEAHLKAYHKAFGFWSSVEETTISFIREALIKHLESPVVRDAMRPHWPKSIQKAFERPRPKVS